MSRYEVYATGWDDPHIREELIPARGLEFTLPLNDHGEVSFSATVEPGKSFWRPSIAPIVSGILICRDGQPVWSGYVWVEEETTPRTFVFRGSEWGSFFERVPPTLPTDGHGNALPLIYAQQNDHVIFRDLISDAQAVAGQNVAVQLGTTTGLSKSDLTINTWDDTTVEAQFRALGDAQGGPEWYFGTAGTLAAPQRVLVLSDRLGSTDPQTVLEYVETTEAYIPPASPPELTLLGHLFPGQQTQAAIGGTRGGNVIANPGRNRDGGKSATRVVAIGGGSEKAQIRATATATDLLAAGYPLITVTNSYPDVTNKATLQRHADADLAARRGLLTSYTFTTFDGEPDWTQVQRGDTLRCIIDTDAYSTDRPLELTPRLLELAVQVPDDGPVLVNWTVTDTLEVA